MDPNRNVVQPDALGSIELLIVEQTTEECVSIESMLRASVSNDVSLHRSGNSRTLNEPDALVPYDALILDIESFPELFPSLFSCLQEITSTTAVILVYGGAQHSIAAKCHDLGVHARLPKEVLRGDVLIDTVENAIVAHRARRERELQRFRSTKDKDVFTDTLASLPDRVAFLNALRQTVNLATRSEECFALLCLDIDLPQDAPLHSSGVFGDSAWWAQIGREIVRSLRDSDLIAHTGERQFSILLRNLGATSRAALVAEKIHANIGEFLIDYQIDAQSSLSIGIAIFPDDGQSDQALLERAESAARKLRCCPVRGYQYACEQMDAEARMQLELEHQLRNALTRGEFVIHFQPSIDLQFGSIVSLEALLRWMHPTLGMIAPRAFLPLARASHLGQQMDAWVLDRVCRRNRAWQQAGQYLRVAVNVCAESFREPELLVKRIESALEASQLAAPWLELEITEASFVLEPEKTRTAIEHLRAMGVYITLDDFGIGVSALNCLRELDVNAVKIDRACIAGIPKDHTSTSLLSAILDMAKALDIRVIAEGVETNEQAEWLRRAACFGAQGYFFAHPAADPPFSYASVPGSEIRH